MLKQKVRYCYECGKNTVHKLVGHESLAQGLGIARIFMAIASLGATETIGADWHYQCQCCGNIEKE